MVVMLRTLGIPARLVNGFRAGDYNRLGDIWTVRQYHAHSWVEAYFGPYGWVEFDPTPTDRPAPRAGWAAVWSDLVETAELWWWEDVINYDLGKQVQLIAFTRDWLNQRQLAARSAAAAVWEDLRGLVPARGKTPPAGMNAMMWGSVVLLLIVAAGYLTGRGRLGLRHWARSFRLRWNLLRPAPAVAGFYRDALALLAARGWRQARGQTALEFAESLRPHPAAAPFAALTALYNRARFGPPDFVVDPETAGGHLKDMHAALRQPQTGPKKPARRAE